MDDKKKLEIIKKLLEYDLKADEKTVYKRDAIEILELIGE